MGFLVRQVGRLDLGDLRWGCHHFVQVGWDPGQDGAQTRGREPFPHPSPRHSAILHLPAIAFSPRDPTSHGITTRCFSSLTDRNHTYTATARCESFAGPSSPSPWYRIHHQARPWADTPSPTSPPSRRAQGRSICHRPPPPLDGENTHHSSRNFPCIHKRGDCAKHGGITRPSNDEGEATSTAIDESKRCLFVPM